MPVFIYCDKGSEFDNKLFTDRWTNGFRVQFTIDRRKAVYAERAIRTLRRGLEQYFAIRPFDNDIKSAIKTIVNGHNHSPSRRNPRRLNGTYSTPFEVIMTPSLMDKMQDALRTRRSRQYTMNLRKKVINKLPKFKEGDLVHYLLRREKFSKESTLSGSWTREIYRILRVHRAQLFKPMHMYTLCKLNMTVPIPRLPSLPEHQIKKQPSHLDKHFPSNESSRSEKTRCSSSGKITTYLLGNRGDTTKGKTPAALGKWETPKDANVLFIPQSLKVPTYLPTDTYLETSSSYASTPTMPIRELHNRTTIVTTSLFNFHLLLLNRFNSELLNAIIIKS